MFDKEFYLNNVFAIAKQQNISIPMLEMYIDVSGGYLVKLRNDDTRKNITAEIMLRISEVLGVSVEYLCKVKCDALNKDEVAVLAFFEKIKKNTLENKYKWECEDSDYISAGQGIIGGALAENNEYGVPYYYSSFQHKEVQLKDKSLVVELKDGVYFAIVLIQGTKTNYDELESYIIKYGDTVEENKVYCTYDEQNGVLGNALRELYNIAEESGKKLSLDNQTSTFIAEFLNEDRSANKSNL